MRAYKIRGKHYIVAGSPPYGGVIRPTRNAAGMQYTYHRGSRRAEISDDTRTLMVLGTLDRNRPLSFRVRFVPHHCKCCGQRINKLALNDAGRRRLNALRRKRQS